MKIAKIATLLIALAMLSVVFAGPVLAKPTETPLTVPSWSQQFQWRGTDPVNYPGGPFGSWSRIQAPYETTTDYTLKGNKLTTFMDYSPAVTNQIGGELKYELKAKTDIWVLQKTEIDYNYAQAYGSYQVTNYFCGYLKFSDVPSKTTFVHGVLYQWVYIYAAKTDLGVKIPCPHAIWDTKMHAWQVGLSIYLDDPVLTANAVQFPSVYFPIEPVPASDFNPLHL